MEEEMESLEHDLKAVEESYGENVLNLTCARGYIKKLLENAKVVRFLNGSYRDILFEFESLTAAESLSGIRRSEVDAFLLAFLHQLRNR